MSRQELAEAANAYLAGRGVTAFLCERNIGRYERGETRWPSAHYRLALRQDGWVPETTGRLRFETHSLLDEMLSRATEEDQQRFDLALTELGEVR